METLSHCIVTCSGHLRPYLKEVSMSLVATALFLYGEDIHSLVKRQIQSLALVFRVAILILVCAFGYGTLAVGCTVLCRKLLGFLDSHYLSPVVFGLFLLIGILAEKKRAV